MATPEWEAEINRVAKEGGTVMLKLGNKALAVTVNLKGGNYEEEVTSDSVPDRSDQGIPQAQ